MLLKTELNLVKSILSVLSLSALCSTMTHATVLDCQQSSNRAKNFCHERYNAQHEQLTNLSLTTLLITDAPHKLIKDTFDLWYQQILQCKHEQCLSQQFDARLDQLNFFTSLNQTLTQHYLKFEHGQMAKQPVHLQIHQLSKDNLKIEATAYRNPNNRLETQRIPFLAYSTVAEKTQIQDNENDCKYQFKYQKAILVVTSQQKGCERFTGIYRLYD